MRTVIVANPSAGGGRVGRSWAHLHQIIRSHYGNTGVEFTEGAGDATHITRRLLAEGCGRVLAVGGDGTVNEVVNGFFEASSAVPLNADAVLAVFPVGTGGDLARTIGLSGESNGPRLADSHVRQIDLGRATFRAHDGSDRARYFLNVSSFGASGAVVDRVNQSTKRLGGKTSFLLGTVRALLSYSNQPIRLRIDDVFDETLTVNTVAVANGRYFGGSMKIAPAALVDDGKLDVTILGEGVGFATFLRHGRALYRGTHVDLPHVSTHRGATITATPLGDTPVLIDLDGEQPGRLPATYEIVPAAIKIYAPWQHTEALAVASPSDRAAARPRDQAEEAPDTNEAEVRTTP